jgi:hypothetical protein
MSATYVQCTRTLHKKRKSETRFNTSFEELEAALIIETIRKSETFFYQAAIR